MRVASGFCMAIRKCIVERVVVKLGHRAKVFLETLGFKEFLDALFQLIRDFTDLLRGIFVFQPFQTSLFFKLHLEADIFAAGYHPA